MKLNQLAFIKKRLATATQQALGSPATLTAVVLAGILSCNPAMAQQAGGIRGKVTTEQAGPAAAGVTITATSNVMPRARTVVTKEDGSYSLPLLIPGRYTLTFTSADGTVRTTEVDVMLEQTSTVDVSLVAPSTSDVEVITITGNLMVVREGNSSLSNSIGSDVVTGIPVGQDYRDLLKLVPGVQLSENSTLGPSAGGSGVHNKYGFDGVDVSLPMFGNLASEPSTHDVEMVSMERGGAKAVGFNRSGGFAINTKSKSGTNEFHGSLDYKLQDASFSSSPKDGIDQDTDRSWVTASLSGPLIQDELFFYGSYYRPEVKGSSKETAYGPVKNSESIRDEYFGKLTWAPTYDMLFNVSYRNSQRTGKGLSIGQYEADSVSQGDKADQTIFTLDGSYIIGDYTTLSFQYSKFELKTAGQPDVMVDVTPAFGQALDIVNLDQMGYLNVPSLLATTSPENIAFNASAQTLIDRYGYLENGVRTGGGGVGVYSTINNQNFTRDTLELALDHEIIGDVIHTIHVGFKYSEGEEELSRLSNGWGAITYHGGLPGLDVNSTDFNSTDVYYIARTQQMSFQTQAGQSVAPIYSSVKSLNLEINDTIEHGDFIYNIGVLISKDTLYGQGLRSTDDGYVVDRGNKYKMYSFDWKDLVQPRLGITWKYDGENTVFANYASYNPEASSLARAASWDRNTAAEMRSFFDENGNYLGSIAASGSSGKMFADNMKPHRIDEFTIGTTKQVTNELFLRAHTRYRHGSHFWEDMPNNGRIAAYPATSQAPGVPSHIVDKGLYIPDLADRYTNNMGTPGATTYVIAEIDDGQTKYWEINLEAEYTGQRTYLNASYVWSHYYGNFDQDYTTGNNDTNTFIGSSLYGDGPGRYSWDNRYGTLSGDKPHIVKVYGYYTTDWDANIGALLAYQSGQPWAIWDATYYGYSPTDGNTSSRYAEPAGSRRSSSHWQLDLSYTQNFKLTESLNMRFRADLFNVFDRQTGYNINPYANSTTFGEARNYYSPRRLQLSIGIDF